LVPHLLTLQLLLLLLLWALTGCCVNVAPTLQHDFTAAAAADVAAASNASPVGLIEWCTALPDCTAAMPS
jgi:hypothetical protein